MQTIFAQATARGKSGVAVIRISGPDAFDIGRNLAGELPDPGRFVYRPIRQSNGVILDRGLVLSFKAPRSFTGEDTVEFQLHGSVAVLRAVETAIAETGLARPAEAGEFTRRALLNDNMDLTQVEALGDLISAETEMQRRQAQSLMDGGLRDVADQLRADLTGALALLEVTIDFADEEVPVDVTPDVIGVLDHVAALLQAEIDGSHVAERLRDGFEVAIIGPPNAGKSTLLNRIAEREVALTSEFAGTTRDVLEVRVDLGGLAVTFLDTAGLRETEDVVEQSGIHRAKQRAQEADIRVFLLGEDDLPVGIEPCDGDIVLQGKADLSDASDGVSGLTGEGIPELLSSILERLEQRVARIGQSSKERHRLAMLSALQSLNVAQDMLTSSSYEVEFVASYLREAVRNLDTLVGAIDVEDVLGAIFSQFCIGK